jgi:hypothetical protein
MRGPRLDRHVVYHYVLFPNHAADAPGSRNGVDGCAPRAKRKRRRSGVSLWSTKRLVEVLRDNDRVCKLDLPAVSIAGRHSRFDTMVFETSTMAHVA